MAMIGKIESINVQSAAAMTNVNTAAKTNDTQIKAETPKAEETVKKPEVKKADREENVVAMSKDGDTVANKPESLKALSEGIVINKTAMNNEEDNSVTRQNEAQAQARAEWLKEQQAEAKERQAELDEVKSDKATLQKDNEKKVAENKQQTTSKDEQITSLTGYTKAQIERLYREGRISKHQYDENMKAKEETENQKVTDDTASKLTEMFEKGKQAQNTMENIELASKNDREKLVSQIF